MELLSKKIDNLRAAAFEPGFNQAPALTQYLCQFYTGLESCLEKILKMAKIAGPAKSENHHRKRLNLVDLLDDLLSFRHFARHGYGVELKGKEILEKAAITERLWPELRTWIESYLTS